MLGVRGVRVSGTTAAVLLVCALAFKHGLQVTADLDWPPNHDSYRDTAQAQTFLNGNWLGDPFYRNAKIWYNPLVPAIVAVASKLSGVPVHKLYSRLGTYLNLLAPLTFAAMVARFCGPRVALPSVVAFLFIQGRTEPPWEAATYSPWLLPNSFAQSLFYSSQMVFLHAWPRKNVRWDVVTGILFGITFLGHTAPAALLAGVALAAALRGTCVQSSAESRTRCVARVLRIALVACAVALPFLYTIVVFYRLRIVNTAPFSWGQAYRWSDLVDLLRIIFHPVGLTALFGAFWIWRTMRRTLEGEILITTSVTCIFFVVYHSFAQFLGRHGIWMPTLVPVHHFLFYLRALECLAFGAGVAACCRRAAQFLQKRLDSTRLGLALERVSLYGVTFGVFLWAYPSYGQRYDFTTELQDARTSLARVDWHRAVAWIEASTADTDIFLCDDRLALFVVGPSGRKVVAVGRNFSNPYLNWRIRDQRRKRMLGFIRAHDAERFVDYASRFEVSYVVVESGVSDADDPFAPSKLNLLPFLEPAFRDGQIAIYRVRRNPLRDGKANPAAMRLLERGVDPRAAGCGTTTTSHRRWRRCYREARRTNETRRSGEALPSRGLLSYQSKKPTKPSVIAVSVSSTRAGATRREPRAARRREGGIM